MAIDPAVYERWWALHVRLACGEALEAADAAFYQATRQHLEQDDILAVQERDLREARQAIARLEAERATLETRRQQIQAEVAAVEAALSHRARQLLGAEG